MVVLFGHFLESDKKILREEAIKDKKTGIEVEVESAEKLKKDFRRSVRYLSKDSRTIKRTLYSQLAAKLAQQYRSIEGLVRYSTF